MYCGSCMHDNALAAVLKDFIGITTLARQVGMLVVHPSLPARSTAQFIALAKARPGEVIYGSAGHGSFGHLAAGRCFSGR